MKYRKNYRRSYKSDPDRGLKKGARDVKQSKEIAKISKVVKRLIPEQKIKSVSGTVSYITSTPTQTLINGMAQGTADAQRIGNAFLMSKIQWNFRLYTNSSHNAQCCARVLLVYDKMPKGTAFSMTDLFGASTVYTWYTKNYLNRDINKRFTIISDKVYKLWPLNTYVPAASSGNQATYNMLNMGGPCSITVNRTIQLNKLTSAPLGTAGTVADIDTGSLYMIYLADTSNSSVVLDYSYNLFYTDQ